MSMATTVSRRPTFFWQGVLILLPVIVLAAVSLIALHQDERTAEKEAGRRAAANAESLAHALRSTIEQELTAFQAAELDYLWDSGSRPPNVRVLSNRGSFNPQVSTWNQTHLPLKLEDLARPSIRATAYGKQVYPSPLKAVPPPATWYQNLSPEQRDIWTALESAVRAHATEGEINTWRERFLASQPDADARLAAAWLAEPPGRILNETNSVQSPSGLSYQELACYQLMTGTNAVITTELLKAVRRQVFDLSAYTSPILMELLQARLESADSQRQPKAQSGILPALPAGALDEALRSEIIHMQNWWAANARATAALDSMGAFREGISRPADPKAAWIQDSQTLAVVVETGFTAEEMKEFKVTEPNGLTIWWFPRALLELICQRAWRQNQFLVPDYLTGSVQLAGVRFDPTNRVVLPGQVPFASGRERVTMTAVAPDVAELGVDFYLTDKNQMLAAERRRSVLVTRVIVGAFVVALAGLVTAYRAFRRQAQLNELKSNFVSSVSHELRAPIASVRLMAEGLERGKIREPAKQQEYFGFIVRECRRLSSLIENVLDFSRIEQGRKQYELEPTNLVALVEQTVQLMATPALEQEIRLELKTTGTPTEVEVDGRAMQQALVNLLDNAIKHSPKGSVISVGLDFPAGTTGAIRLWVEDHGPGIPASEHNKIFDRFYRLGSELRRETEGVGIGLSIVKYIVEAHHGKVTVRSAPGEGSRFTIELPGART